MRLKTSMSRSPSMSRYRPKSGSRERVWANEMAAGDRSVGSTPDREGVLARRAGLLCYFQDDRDERC